MKKYIAHPGPVTSTSDGDHHFIGFRQLCELHCVNPSEAVDASRKDQTLGLDTSKLIPLHVSPSGNYPLLD